MVYTYGEYSSEVMCAVAAVQSLYTPFSVWCCFFPRFKWLTEQGKKPRWADKSPNGEGPSC